MFEFGWSFGTIRSVESRTIESSNLTAAMKGLSRVVVGFWSVVLFWGGYGRLFSIFTRQISSDYAFVPAIPGPKICKDSTWRAHYITELVRGHRYFCEATEAMGKRQVHDTSTELPMSSSSIPSRVENNPI
ncbi:hypothetical protein K435DRAFT_811278 [Dendrothele bispora CBS 962.96]|uniref:Uncharacterized protein n=1 Tax=Dendrothele bispora (strain CBS 962.96) TaxID=1314807 RepID=A0A4S8KSL3_DENBC|nr:hypothetical protein K435DRAFT_811278 [Dendrothele bispora CBS 962.96]